MPATIEQLKREALAGLASLDGSLANMPPLEPDVETMISAPAATVAGSVNLLDAVNARLIEAGFKPTCDEAGNWRYVPAASIDGPRVPAEAVAAVNLDPLLYAAVASALSVPADAARAAVEGAEAKPITQERAA